MIQRNNVMQITIDLWPKLAMSKNEIRNILHYLAYKTDKPAIFRKLSEYEGYSENTVCVCMAVADNSQRTSKISSLRVNGKTYELSDEQVLVDIDLNVPDEKQITDEDGIPIAYVDHNRIVIPIELTATDNEAARKLLAYIVESSIELLDFRMTTKLLEQRRKMTEGLCNLFAVSTEKKLEQTEKSFKDFEERARYAYVTIYTFERQKPVLEKEIRFLKKLQQIKKPRLYRKQAHSLIELLASGQFTSIEPQPDGELAAVTGPVSIDYNDWQFSVGSYSIRINAEGNIRIEPLDEHPNADCPHPHVATDGSPCLGNIASEIPKLIGSMRMAEALQLLYQFLSSYNPDSPYEKISHYDPTGKYYDEEDEPCENCDESCSGYCIFECDHNTGQYTCMDCYDYRTDYCYLECEHNEDFVRFSPCDDCREKATEHCHLNCQFNNTWQLQNPCDENCSYEECSKECPYFEKSKILMEVTENENQG